MKIVVTGATSFLGQATICELTDRKMDVCAIIRPVSKNREIYANNPLVHSVFFDMSETEYWKQQVGNADAFIHFGWDGIGAQGRADKELQKRNVACTISCLQAAIELGCRSFLFAGSQSEYGPQTDWIKETSLCNPILEYAKGKLEAGQCGMALAAQSGIRFYHARIFSVYGPGDHPWALVPSCIRTLCAGESMSLSSCEQHWNYLYVADCAKMLCDLLCSDAPSAVYNVAGRDTRPLKEFVYRIWEACGKQGSLQFGNRTFSEKPVSLKPDISRLERVIGVTSEHSFETQIHQMVQQYQRMGGV